MRYLLLTLTLLLVVSLAGCGFQLRGSYQLPPQLQQATIAAPQFSEVAEQVRQRFTLAGVDVVETSNTDTTAIEIVRDSLTRRTLSLSASGQVAEYELIYTVDYLLRAPNKTAKALQVEVFRDYQDDPNFALAKTREREVLVAEMREQAAQQVLRQVIAQLAESP
ncbi:LPS assembly lipoprotein LptE [Pseudidiomarina sp.]|uniref:LPS-assembly lipoprotein LptE n=1 Tax=Pseudidiomarina sp. TaxID=2081707 RepID=UPI003A96E174|tara:strand:+ start:1376 stop:1870 length:495 start_codon:yes stop_codon:yes gene_type:complete